VALIIFWLADRPTSRTPWDDGAPGSQSPKVAKPQREFPEKDKRRRKNLFGRPDVDVRG